MAGGPRELGLSELADHREIYDILLGYALRGVRVQIVLRACLVAFVVLVVLIVPPANDRVPCYLIAAAYALWSLAVALLARCARAGPAGHHRQQFRRGELDL